MGRIHVRRGKAGHLVPAGRRAAELPPLAGTLLAHKLGFVQQCESGAISGLAFVPADVAGDWTEVSGFGTLHRPKKACFRANALARHVEVGVYHVRAVPDS